MKIGEEAIYQKPNFLSRPQGIIFIILLIAALWVVYPGDPATLALYVVAIVFLFGLKRPVWAMAALLISQLTITSYMVETPLGIPISLRLCLLLLILIGALLLHYRNKGHIKMGKQTKSILIPAFILVGIIIVSNLIYTDFYYTFAEFRNMMVGLLIIIFLPSVTKDSRDLKILCGAVFVVMVTSAIIGVMQHYQVLGMSQHTLIPGFLQQWGSEEIRVPGIAESELDLSYTVSVVALAILGILLIRGAKTSNKWLLAISLMPLGLALYFTYTRSALFAMILGLVALVMFLRTRIKGEVILFGILLVVLFIAVTGLMENQYLGGRDVESQEQSLISRKILWQAGLAIAMDNPVLGIGGNQYALVAPQYTGYVDPTLMQFEEETFWGYRTLGSVQPHNDFLMIWISYGTLALAVYLWLYVAILRNFLRSYEKSNRRFVKGLAIGLAAGLVAYGVNAFYHNCLETFPLFWILAGFSLAIAKLAVKEKSQARISQSSTGASP